MYNCFFLLLFSRSFAQSHTHTHTPRFRRFSSARIKAYNNSTTFWFCVCIANNFGNTWIQNEQTRHAHTENWPAEKENSDFHIKAQCLINKYPPTLWVNSIAFTHHRISPLMPSYNSSGRKGRTSEWLTSISLVFSPPIARNHNQLDIAVVVVAVLCLLQIMIVLQDAI